MCNFIGRPQITKKELSCKNEVDEASMTKTFSFQQKDLYVRIVRAGGFIDLYGNAIFASQVMDKYPGMCVTRPEIFKRPHESLVQPEEKLHPGQKFYLVPRSTVNKLKHKYPEVFQIEESIGAGLDSGLTGSKMLGGEDEEFSISAKDFFVSPERWSRSAVRGCKKDVKRPFVPPIKGARIYHGLGWQPNLPSVKELSP